MSDSETIVCQRPLRVLMITPYAPARDGIGDYSGALARELRRQGCHVEVVSSSGLGGPDDVAALLPSLRAYRERASLAIRIRHEFDLVHVQFAVASFGTRVPSLVAFVRSLRAAGAPIVITMHEVTRDTHLLKGPGRQGYRLFAALADRIVVHTHTAEQLLTRRLGTMTPVQVIRQVTAEPPTPLLDPKALRSRYGLGSCRILLAFGFLTRDKGLDVLVDALAVLRRRRSLDDVRIVVAGAVRQRRGLFRIFELNDHRYVAGVRRRARRTGVETVMAFTGYVPAEETAVWFNAADAAVLPYRRIEDSAVAAMAAAAGTPLLVSDAGELHFTYPSMSFAAGSSHALAEALEQFLRGDYGATTEWRRTGRPSLPVVATETAAVYAALACNSIPQAATGL